MAPPTLRLATAADADGVAAIYAPVVATTAISFEETPPASEEMARRIRATLETHPWLVCEEADQILGYAYATSHRARAAYRWSVETTVYVAEAARRRGVGRGLYLSLFAVLELQGYVSAYAGITQPNEASVALHEGVGFERLGTYRDVGFKLGAWRDVGWWQRHLGPPPDEPRSPQRLDEARRLPGWEAALAAGLAALG
ncbi:MAG: arsinothricin resistance N-acetyltransferase ArsN1 family B [Thermoanaerobaculia bacterium]|nr:arsinothricin resistance N-acetyltransferase ArsN1 family B [Thermoanaerobaculia bacterium]